MESVRKQVFDLAYNSLPKEEGDCVGLKHILNGNEKSSQILPKVEDWLDKNCNNGYHSRWTLHGEGIYNDALALVNKMRKIESRL